MTLKRLAIQHLRNLQDVEIKPAEHVNLFFGENGSGKTSILEAISLLGLGRSFRSHKHKSLINYDQPAFTVFGRVNSESTDVPLGINRKRNGEASFKAGGATVPSAATLASYLPLQVINADTFLLLEGSPKVRRQFIDWLVFHVEPRFFPVWKDLQRCLKHRNSLLRHDRIDRFELATWDQELIRLTEQAHAFRKVCMERFSQTFFQLIEEFPELQHLGLNYYSGWDEKKSYQEVLDANFERDKRQGYTQAGSHRADLQFLLNGMNAADLLSRGQQKLLICALKIAQGYLFNEMTGRKCIYLIDDLPAELDERHRSLLVNWLDAMSTQVFITGVESEVLISSWQDQPDVELKLFHVEHGKIRVAFELPEVATDK